jgi:hypothetical protein
MKIARQKPAFELILITLESEEEVAALWDLAQSRLRYARSGEDLTSISEFCAKLNNYFSDRKKSLLS